MVVTNIYKIEDASTHATFKYVKKASFHKVFKRGIFIHTFVETKSYLLIYTNMFRQITFPKLVKILQLKFQVKKTHF